MEAFLLIAGCGIFLALGVGHACLLLCTTRFEPVDPDLLQDLKTKGAQIAPRGTMWRGLQGFHLSHSLCFAFFGGLYIALALESFALLHASMVLNVCLLAVPVTLTGLAHRYWFNVPRNACALGLVLIAASMAVR
ncbi:LIC_13387 family protein [Rhodoferax aquaticus]|uniref:Uncharacterized protein n=1 Tax=Rhodoferax aquaticus TaxID=2527691 RepID=A0A515EMP3_9BURK|nr:hypothetical protein [Rhodoferax aquaticus]QDL53931.1 hypothetical protein EXZ61_06985 [Rhodoferax aquaticus]